ASRNVFVLERNGRGLVVGVHARTSVRCSLLIYQVAGCLPCCGSHITKLISACQLLGRSEPRGSEGNPGCGSVNILTESPRSPLLHERVERCSVQLVQRVHGVETQCVGLFFGAAEHVESVQVVHVSPSVCLWQ